MAYRSLNFRDNILWPLAYALGLDPSVELLVDQAAALTTYINNWVRKAWDSTDWPEWTIISAFTPDTNNLVSYTLPSGTDMGDFPILNTTPIISRVFKVYLANPNLSQGAYDTGFRLFSNGIHVGFEHGSTVWIRYILTPPQFTSDEWDPNQSYPLNAGTYSPASGECYVSRINNNLGNDPSMSPSQWSFIPFPFALTDIVLRGAYADCLKEWGQNEKAAASEQLAIQEGQARASNYLGLTSDKLTDQTQPKPRYTTP